MICYWWRSTWIVQILRLPQRRSTPTLRPRQVGHHPPHRLAHPAVAIAATVATGTRTITRTATAVMAVATPAGTATAVATVMALLATPPSSLPLMAESTCHGIAASVGLHGHVGPLLVTRVPTRPAVAAAALLAGRSRSITRLEPLGQHGLGPAIASPVLQHHDAPPTSDFGPRLGGRLRRNAPHHPVSW
jgi:hypothetical protein